MLASVAAAGDVGEDVVVVEEVVVAGGAAVGRVAAGEHAEVAGKRAR